MRGVIAKDYFQLDSFSVEIEYYLLLSVSENFQLYNSVGVIGINYLKEFDTKYKYPSLMK